MSKVCHHCNVKRNLDDFYNRTYTRTNGEKYLKRDTRCKYCHKIYREKNKEKIKLTNQKYYINNKDDITKRYVNRMQREDVKEKRREYMRQYKKSKKEQDVSFKYYENARKRIWKILRENKKGLHTKDIVGCSPFHYKMWITYTMRDDMTWDNYGKYWSIDHVIGINNYDLSKKENINIAFNWKNTFALENKKNFTKKDKIDDDLLILKNKYLKTFEKIIKFKSDLKWTIRSQATLKKVEGSETR